MEWAVETASLIGHTILDMTARYAVRLTRNADGTLEWWVEDRWSWRISGAAV